MIIDLTMENVFSIGKEQKFSFEAYEPADNGYEEHYICKIPKRGEYKKEEDRNYRLLKVALLLGANASGKSNILKSFDLLNEIMLKTRNRNEKFNYEPFLLNPKMEEVASKLCLNFLLEDDDGQYSRYKYLIEFTKNEILRERLDKYLSSQPSLVFERVSDEDNARGFRVEYGKKFKPNQIETMTIEANTLPNNSIISIFNKSNPLFNELKKVYGWGKKSFTMIIAPNTNTTRYTNRLLASERKLRDLGKSVLINADFNISNIDIDVQEIELNDKEKKLLKTLSEKAEENISIDDLKRRFYDLKLTHKVQIDGEEVEREFEEDLESLGTMKFYSLLGPYFSAFKINRLMMIDEIETSLHWELQKSLITLFLINSKKSQLIFATHNPLYLMWDIIRADSIYFTEKKDNGETDLYSLVDFNNINRENIFKKYLIGNYGAVPNINEYDLDLKL